MQYILPSENPEILSSVICERTAWLSSAFTYSGQYLEFIGTADYNDVVTIFDLPSTVGLSVHYIYSTFYCTGR